MTVSAIEDETHLDIEDVLAGLIQTEPNQDRQMKMIDARDAIRTLREKARGYVVIAPGTEERIAKAAKEANESFRTEARRAAIKECIGIAEKIRDKESNFSNELELCWEDGERAAAAVMISALNSLLEKEG